MNVQQAYDLWSSQYDTNDNKTRDIEAKALKASLENIDFRRCLEIGCGTGKNTEWLITKASYITAIDFSLQMLAKAKQKVSSDKINFQQADVTHDWTFAEGLYDLVTFSLILEHIEDLEPIFKKTSNATATGGYVYVGELHPFKQYLGSKARFNTMEGQQVVKCHTHNISDFTRAAKKCGLEVEDVNEHFDGNDPSAIPRLLTLLFRKSNKT